MLRRIEANHMNFQDHIRRYLELVASANRLFEAVHREHGHLMGCKPGCDECCSVYYELSLIEAFVINGMFDQVVSRSAARRALKRAESVEPLFLKAKEDLLTAPQDTATQAGLQEAAARIRLQCPLNEEGGCVLYEYRPITCRLYGVPQKISGRVVSCPRSGFLKGDLYTTVDVDDMQRRLFEFSREFLEDMVGVGPSAPPGPLFFIATALRTRFDKGFFLSLREGLQ
jgi:hypothetical protein